MVCLLAAGSLFVVGRFVNAFAAFILLPVAVGFVIARFFHHLPGDSRPARWPALLARNILILALLLRLMFVGFEIYCRFVCDRTDATGNTLISVAWYSRYFHKNSLGLRDDVD